MYAPDSCSKCKARSTSARRTTVRCRAEGGWPWGRHKSVPPPPPPPPPPPSQQAVSTSSPADLLRTSPKWRSWPANSASASGLDSSNNTQQVRSSQQQQQLSPDQQAALQQMLLDSTVNPKWRWPSFRGSGSAAPRQQQAPKQWPQQPPPPAEQRSGSQRRQRRNANQGQRIQQQEQMYAQEQLQQQVADSQQLQQQGQWQWPFVGGAFEATPDEDFRRRLEAMGVDMVGRKGRKQQQETLKAFDQMNDREIARYMTQLRQNRLERVQNKQDDEVVGIAGLYLTVTLVILLMAALANLPI